jgi:outer membrane protein assembly factor BamD
MRYLILVLTVLVFTSCNSFNKLLKSDNPEEQLNAAIEYYENGDYFRTQQLMENIIASYRGTVQAEKIYYYYAYSFYHMKDYITAAFHFNSLTKSLPNSQYAEEAMYMSAYCKFLFSPDYYLDQTFTKEAIQEMQLFINKYPQSTRVADANRIIDEMRAKMELKSFEAAKIYMQLEEYNASIIAFRNVISDFPGTSYTEEALFLILKSWYLYAQGSIASKQAERYEQVKKVWEEFSSDFPESKYKNEALFYYSSAVKNIEKIQNTTQNIQN